MKKELSPKQILQFKVDTIRVLDAKRKSIIGKEMVEIEKEFKDYTINWVTGEVKKKQVIIMPETKIIKLNGEN